MKLEHHWVNKIEEIDVSSWDNIYNESSIYKSYAFAKAIEGSNLKGVNLHYLTLHNEGKICAIVPCFKYNVELEILAGNGLKKIVYGVRNIFPNFLKSNLFVIGSPVATCENHIAVHKDLQSDEVLNDVGTEIFNQVIEKAKIEKAKLIIVKEIPNAELGYFKKLFGDKFKIFESLPNSFIPLFKDKYPYPAILRNKYRQRYKSALRENETENYQWELLEDFSSVTNEMYELYLNVYNKSKNKFEKLTLDFFKKINEELGPNSFAVLCKDTKGNLLCAELVIVDKKTLIPIYMGLNYSLTLNGKVYQNVIFRTLLEAEKRGKEWLILGQTSYETKAYSGAHFEKLFLGVISYSPTMNSIIKKFFKYLFPVFTKPNVHSINKDVLESSEFTERMTHKSRIFE